MNIVKSLYTYLPVKKRSIPEGKSSDNVTLIKHDEASFETLHLHDNGREDFGILSDDSTSYTYSSPEDDYLHAAAPPLQDMYRYHLFFSHSLKDQPWVENLVQTLSREPYDFRCSYNKYEQMGRGVLLQNTLCSAMLSERVVIVLSESYVNSTWNIFLETLKGLTSTSLYKQRMILIQLEYCDIPEPLQGLGHLSAQADEFLSSFLRSLRSDRLPRSFDSVSSGMSSLSNRSVHSNGQTISSIEIQIAGWCRATLVVHTEKDIPTGLTCHGIHMNYREYINIANSIICPYGDNDLSWILSRKPYIVMAVALLSWLIAFLLVIILLIDAPKSSALPIRLTVFVLPLASLGYAYVVRWKRRRLRENVNIGLKTNQTCKLRENHNHLPIAGRRRQSEENSRLLEKMLHNSIFVNKALQEDSKSVITTVTCNDKGIFHLFFIYFEMSGCVNAIDLLLNTYIEEDIQKILLLVEFHVDDKLHLTKSSLSKRLIVIMAAMYGFYLQRQLLPSSSQERHIKQHQCLCQFVEECISNILFSLNKSEEEFYSTYSLCLGLIRTRKTLKHLYQKMKDTDELPEVQLTIDS